MEKTFQFELEKIIKPYVCFINEYLLLNGLQIFSYLSKVLSLFIVFITISFFQTPNQKDKIKSSYPTSDLYTACENFDAVDIMDISLKKGDIVAVIKQQDPMGNKMRWFVDRGGNNYSVFYY